VAGKRREDKRPSGIGVSIQFQSNYS
jgi:hypothetical protein